MEYKRIHYKLTVLKKANSIGTVMIADRIMRWERIPDFNGK